MANPYGGQGAQGFVQGLQQGYKYSDDMKTAKQNRENKQREADDISKQRQAQYDSTMIAQDKAQMQNEGLSILQQELKDLKAQQTKSNGMIMAKSMGNYTVAQGKEAQGKEIDNIKYLMSKNPAIAKSVGIQNIDTIQQLDGETGKKKTLAYLSKQGMDVSVLPDESIQAIMDMGILVEADGETVDMMGLTKAIGSTNYMSAEEKDIYDAQEEEIGSMFEKANTIAVAEDKARVKLIQEKAAQLAGVNQLPSDKNTTKDLRGTYGKFIDDYMRTHPKGTIADADEAWNKKEEGSTTPGTLEKTFEFLKKTGMPEDEAMSTARSIVGRSPTAQALLLQDMIDEETDPKRKKGLEDLLVKNQSTGGNVVRKEKDLENMDRMTFSDTYTTEDLSKAFTDTGNVQADTANKALRSKAKKIEAEMNFSTKDEAQKDEFIKQVVVARGFNRIGNGIEKMVEDGTYKAGMLDDMAKIGVGMLPKTAVDFIDPENKWYDSMLTDSRMDKQLVEYIKTISGLAVSEPEYNRLKNILQGTFSSEEARLGKLREFHADLRQNLNDRGDSLVKMGYTHTVPSQMSLLNKEGSGDGQSVMNKETKTNTKPTLTDEEKANGYTLMNGKDTEGNSVVLVVANDGKTVIRKAN